MKKIAVELVDVDTGEVLGYEKMSAGEILNKNYVFVINDERVRWIPEEVED